MNGNQITYALDFPAGGKGGRQSVSHRTRSEAEPPCPAIPRIARLMALAIRFDRMLQNETIQDYAELARLGRVTRARITQIMKLRHLAPDIQEQILFLPRTERGHDVIHLRQLQPLALAADWRRQRRMWQNLYR